MTSEAIAVPASRPTTAAGPARSGPPPRSIQPPTLAAEARLAAELAEGRHVAPEQTAWVIGGYFDPGSRTLTWARAGHPPPILVGGSWARPLDPPGGILLGAGHEEYTAAVLDLAPDDLLLLYSDGLIERRDRSLEEGLARLSRAVRGIADPELAIDAALRALGSTEAEDDTCLVALRVL